MRRWLGWWRAGHRTRQQRLMSLVGLVVALEFFENLMFVFSAAHVMGGLDASPAEFVGAQAGYALGCLLAIVLQQRLSQRLGYRRLLTGSLLLFAAGLLGCAFSTRLAGLVGARAVEGLGGGAFFTSGRVLILLLFGPAERPQALRRFMVLMFSATALAPVCAATLIEDWGWNSVFLVVLPLAWFAGAALCLQGAFAEARLPRKRPLMLVGLLPERPDVAARLHTLEAALRAQGLGADAARQAALARLSALLDTQSLLLACEDLYRLLAAAAVLVLCQRRLA